MTLLTIIQRTCGVLGLPQPSAVVGSSDRQTLQLLELLYEEGESLLNVHDWSWALTTKTFTCLASEAQTGEPPTTFLRFTRPGQGEYIVWNDTNNQPIIGPMSASDWTEYLARGVTEYPQYWRLIDGVLNISSPVVSQSIRYEYVSKSWTSNSADYTVFGADTDTIEFPENLVRRGLKWRFKQAKGLDYAEDMRSYELLKAEAIANDKGAASITSTSRDSMSNEPAPAMRRMWYGTVTG
jgi:hypothetical protein